MLVSFIRYIQGYLKILITGYSPERFLNLCKTKNITTWGLEAVRNGYEMYIKVSGFRKIKPILRKTRTKVVITERVGLPFVLHRYRRRKLFFIGIFICAILVYSMSFFIWNIELQGNRSITDDVLLEYLETQDVSHGIPRYMINCEKLVQNIRENFNEIIWVSVSLEGTRLIINIKENTDTFKENVQSDEPCDIISDKSGIVVSIITRKGTPKVSVGDTVEVGEVLVSGTIEVLNDAKEVVAYQYVNSDADILLQTNVEYNEYISKEYEKKIYTKKDRNLFGITVGSYAIELGLKKNSYKLWEQHTGELQMKIGENFYLPIYVSQKIIKEYELKTMEYNTSELEKLLKDNFNHFCSALEEENSVICDKQFKIIYDTEGATVEAVLTLYESAGIPRKIVDFLQEPMLE